MKEENKTMGGKKQVILLMTDSTRYDMLGCYGNSGMITPNLDRLAQKGLRFTRAYSCQPVCGPARAAIFTGQYPHSCGGFTNSYALCDNVKTIGQRLTDRGIHAAYIGKYHLDGGDYFGLGRCPDGWDPDYFYDMRMYLEELPEEERRMSRRVNRDRSDVREEQCFGHRVSNRAIDFLDRFQDESFFLTVSYDEPHSPFLMPDRFRKMYEDYEFPKYPNVWDTLEGKPEYQKVWAGNSRLEDRDKIRIKHPLFLGCNSFADYEIGRVLDAVERCCPDAMVIYTSDHGDALCSHCLTAKGPAAYDEIARIPLIIKGGLEGCVSSVPVSHINLAPMILEYMGIPIPRLLEGKSILPILWEPERDINGEIFIEFMRYECDQDGFGGFRPMRSIYDGRYKLSVHLLDSTDEMYDMETDPYEMQNLIGNPDNYNKAVELHEKLLAWMNRTRDSFRGYDWERRPWRKDARAATWAYTGYARQRENEEYEPRQLDYATGMPMETAVRVK